MNALPMHARVFVPPGSWHNSVVELDKEESHHLLHVLRVREGQAVGILNGQGGVGLANVASVGKGAVTLEIGERREVERPAARITLFQSLPREQHMDLIIQKATELEVSAIVPLQAARSVVKLDAAKAEQRRARWERIALGAVKQSGNPWLPVVEQPCSLDALLKRALLPEFLLVGSLHEGAQPLRDALRAAPARRPLDVGVFIGPEGDFTGDEMERMLARGAKPVRFGTAVLRVETAAVFMLSVLRYEFC